MDVKISPKVLGGRVNAPASKSVAHRLLICAALANEPSEIIISKTSEDIEATVRCLEAIGVKIETDGQKYICTPPASYAERAVLDCGESGSTLRFMLPVAAALGVEATFTGRGRLPSRPLEPLAGEMKRHGISFTEGFPFTISGKLGGGEYTLRGDVSSQFITGLLLALPMCGEDSVINLLPPIESRPYIDITVEALAEFSVAVEQSGNTYTVKPSRFKGGSFTAQGDWSNAAFWLASGVGVGSLKPDSTQGDKKILDVLRQLGADIYNENGAIRADVSSLRGAKIDAADIPDLVPVICAVAATAQGETVIYNAARLRIKESDRIQTTVQLINSLGGCARETEDGIVVSGKPSLRGGEVDGCGDHRIVMSAAVAAIHCENDVIIRNAQAVAKSYPDFFKEYNLLGGAADVMQLR